MRLRINDEFKFLPLMKKNVTYPLEYTYLLSLQSRNSHFILSTGGRIEAKHRICPTRQRPARERSNPCGATGANSASGNSAATSLRRRKGIPPKKQRF
jgi:hypothetical protein